MNPVKVRPQNLSVITFKLAARELAQHLHLVVFLHVAIQIFHPDIETTLGANSHRLIPVESLVNTLAHLKKKYHNFFSN